MLGFFITFVQPMTEYTALSNLNFMKSTIRVEMDFNIKEPVLQITLDKDSSELADQTLNYFVEKANSRGMEILWPFSHDQHNTKPQIRIKDDPSDKVLDGTIRQNVKTNSIKFREWLDLKNIQWEPNEHMTTIIGDHDKYDIGFEFGIYHADNAPRN